MKEVEISTPRTDAAAQGIVMSKFATIEQCLQEREKALRECSQQLERENAAMREVIESAGEALLAFNDVGACKAFYDMKDQSLELLKPYVP